MDGKIVGEVVRIASCGGFDGCPSPIRIDHDDAVQVRDAVLQVYAAVRFVHLVLRLEN